MAPNLGRSSDYRKKNFEYRFQTLFKDNEIKTLVQHLANRAKYEILKLVRTPLNNLLRGF